MSTQAISAETFINEYTKELHNKNAAVFAGAGLSMASGYVDWKSLLKEIIEGLGLDPAKETDLVTIAQYHCNQAGGSKTGLTRVIFEHFAPNKTPTANHRILAQLPIQTYWTTNYDRLIEKSLEEAKKVPDVKHELKQLPSTRPGRDACVFKMHGDIDHPADAIICKDDYEAYPLNMNAFVTALRGDLVEKTFLFLGFSFTDPNIDYILSRVRMQYEKHQRHHYCIQKLVTQDPKESPEDFEYKQRKQQYFIQDLKRFGILTVLVEDYPHVTDLLNRVAQNYKRKSVYISGSAAEYGAWDAAAAHLFLHKLSQQILSTGSRVITGFGSGIGSAVLNGALAFLNNAGRTISDEEVVIRPFPQVVTGGVPLDREWANYRKAMIDHAGIAIFVFGNKADAAGKVMTADGVRKEFDLCETATIRPLPVGATGYAAADLWKEVWDKFDHFYPEADGAFRSEFEKLGDPSKTPDELLGSLKKLIHQLQKA